jgi:uncharacterized membrane protein YfcA
LDWQNAFVLFAAAMLGGAVNAVAGGGTLLTFPALLWAGQLEIVANATSTVALWPGALSSFWTYRAELHSGGREIALLAAPSFLGGIVGALLLLHTDNATFAAIAPYLVLLATGLFAAQRPLARWQSRRTVAAAAPGQAETVVAGPRGQGAAAGRWAAVLAFQFLVGLYGGYFGAGIGILMLAALGYLGFTNIHHMNALKNLNAMCINGIAAVLFVAKGLVDWRFGLLMAVGAILGGVAGAGWARRAGQDIVRRGVVFIGMALALWLLARQMGLG